MPEYLTPGVYVEEVPSAVKPIAGVGTSTAGFIGIVADNVPMPEIPGKDGQKYTKVPAGQAVRLTGWEQFKKNFGDFNTGNRMLAHGVYGFFNNGGTACWVIRVTDADSYQAALDTFKSIDEIALVAIPGVVDTTVQETILAHCEKMKDRFAIFCFTNLEKGRILGDFDKVAFGVNQKESWHPAFDLSAKELGLDLNLSITDTFREKLKDVVGIFLKLLILLGNF